MHLLYKWKKELGKLALSPEIDVDEKEGIAHNTLHTSCNPLSHSDKSNQQSYIRLMYDFTLA